MRPDRGALPSRPPPGSAGAPLGELYTAHARMVHGICRLILRDTTDAEDATQQVFLLAYRSLLSGTIVESPGAWLGAIARNECRGRVGARMREPLRSLESTTLVSPGAEDQAVDRAELSELYSELAALPEKQRDAVVLRDLFGLRYDEVATALGTTRPAVEGLLFRGRRRLQRRLRPGLAAGILVVPLAIHESLAYAVPGFASTAVPAGAGAVVALPLLAKLATGGAALALAGSVGVAVEEDMHDRAAPASDVAVTRKLVAYAAHARPSRVSVPNVRDIVGVGTDVARAATSGSTEYDDTKDSRKVAARDPERRTDGDRDDDGDRGPAENEREVEAPEHEEAVEVHESEDDSQVVESEDTEPETEDAEVDSSSDSGGDED